MIYLNYYRFSCKVFDRGGFMTTTKFDERFFESTRGKIVLLLRGTQQTVNELADELKLTDNAVRAHLIMLERDRLVEPAGTVKGFRKPHYAYRLTDEARHLFPKSYDSLLNRLLDVLKQRMPSSSVGSILEDVGRMIGVTRLPSADEPLADRLNNALDALADLGGAAVVIKENDQTQIKSESCPFADAVVEHPEICKIAESMIQEIVGVPVKETCDRSGSPRCRFAIDASA